MTADIYTHTSAEAERDAAIALEQRRRSIAQNRNNFATPN